MKEGEILQYVQQQDKPISKEIFGAGYNTGKKAVQTEAARVPLPEGYVGPNWIARGMIDAATVLHQDARMGAISKGAGRDLIASDLVDIMVFASHMANQFGIELDEEVSKRSAQSRQPSPNQGNQS